MKKTKVKLVSKKAKNVPIKPIDVAVMETLSKYVEKDFNDNKDNIEIDLSNLFKKYPNYEYKGYSTQLGMLEDLIVMFDTKE